MTADITPDTPASIRVLHVEDDPDFAALTATFLSRVDDRFEVETAEGASEGLSSLDAGEFDCVVSDYEMPGDDGIEFLRAVREDHPDLPFVLFTGRGSEAVASDAISAGVTDYLQKESSTEQYELLANRLVNLVEAHYSEQALVERTRRLETLIDNLPGMVYRCENRRGWPMETVEGEAEALTGYRPATIESNEVQWGDLIHPDDREATWDAVQAAVTDGEKFEVSYRVVTRTGDTKPVWERGRGVRDDDGDLVALEGFITDISERTEP
jgi:PAS domain S-box-containing protein